MQGRGGNFLIPALGPVGRSAPPPRGSPTLETPHQTNGHLAIHLDRNLEPPTKGPKKAVAQYSDVGFGSAGVVLFLAPSHGRTQVHY